jgi:DNA-binding CsgD family transcriptional regulator
MDRETRRDREWLAGQLAEAGRRRGFAVVLRERPGRRSRLLDRFAADVAGWRLLRLDPAPDWQRRPAAGLEHLLTRLQNEVPETRAAQARLAEGLVIAEHGQREGAAALLPGHLHGLLEQSALHAPLLVLVDGAHLLDEVSSEVLVRTLQRRSVPGLAVVCSVVLGRAPRFEGSGLHVRDVGRMTLADTARAIEERTGIEPPADVIERLIAHVDAAADRLSRLVDLLTTDHLAGWRELPVPLPPVVDPSEEALLDRFPAATCEALALVSLARVSHRPVIGRALALAGRSLADLEVAERAGVVRFDGATVTITRPVVGSLSVTRVDQGRQRACHAALAQAIMEQAPGEAVAEIRHRIASSPAAVGRREVARLREVAHGAAVGGDLVEAARLLVDAAAWSQPGDERAACLLDAARFARHDGGTAWAARLLADASREASSPLLQARVHEAKARLAVTRGAVDAQAAMLVTRAARIAAAQPDAAAVLYVTAATASVMAGRVADARRCAGHALALAAPGSSTAVAAASWLGGLEVVAGERARGLQRLQDEGIDAIVATGGASIVAAPGEEYELLVWARGWSLLVRLLSGDLDRVRVELRTLIGEVEAVGRRGLVALPLSILSLAEFRRGWWDAAEAHARRALELAEEAEQPAMGANGHVTLATIAAARGDVVGCNEHLAAIRRVGATDGAELLLGFAEAAEGLLRLGLGEARDAVQHLEEAHRLATSQGIADPGVLGADGDLVQACVESGHVAEAAVHAARLGALAEDQGWTSAVAARCRALVSADHDDALVQLQTSDRGFRDLPMPFERARSRLLAAELHLGRGDLEEAASDAGLARATFEDLRATPWRRRADRALDAASAARAGGAALAALTEQERRVVALVADGGSNRDVALALVLSPKTVEYHLRNVYAKLGIANRSQLVRLVLEAGSDPI